MTFDDFKEVYASKSLPDKLKLLLVQEDFIRGDARQQESATWRCNYDEASYWGREVEGLQRRVEWLVGEITPALEAEEKRRRLEVHNIGNVDIPDGVTAEQFHAVMNNVVDALEHSWRGESWPYGEERE